MAIIERCGAVMANKNWTEDAVVALVIVRNVLGEQAEKMGPYVSAKKQLELKREGLYKNAFKVLKSRMTAEQLDRCKAIYLASKLDVEDRVHQIQKDGVL